MMTSWQNQLVEVGLRYRFKRPAARIRSVEPTLWHHALRPTPYAPPRRLDRLVELSIDGGAGWPVYVVTPKRLEPKATVLYLHGGAYVAEITAAHWRFAARLAARAGVEVRVPIYPLAPVATAAATVDGAAEVLAGLVAAGDGRVVVVGDCAGGGLGLAATQRLRDAGGGKPARLVLLSPWLDLTMTAPGQAALDITDPFLDRRFLAEVGRTYGADLALTDPRVSPIFGDLAGLPPLVIFSGTRSLLHPDALALAERAAAAGTECDLRVGPGLPHVHPLLPTPEGRVARDQIVTIVAGSAGVRCGMAAPAPEPASVVAG